MPTEPEKRTETQQKRTETHGENEENKGEEKENTRENEEKTEEKREEKRENTMITVKSTISPEKTAISPKEKKGDIEEKTPEEKTEAGGFPVLLVVGGLVVLGCLAGVGWFLGRRPDTRNRVVPAAYRPPTPAERAMMRVGSA